MWRKINESEKRKTPAASKAAAQRKAASLAISESRNEKLEKISVMSENISIWRKASASMAKAPSMAYGLKAESPQPKIKYLLYRNGYCEIPASAVAWRPRRRPKYGEKPAGESAACQLMSASERRLQWQAKAYLAAVVWRRENIHVKASACENQLAWRLG
jgi:hypothetical protein